MASAVPYVAQDASAAATGTSRVISADGLVEAPVAQIIISVAATVTLEQSFDLVNWVALLSVTSTDALELDPRGVFYRASWADNTGTVAVIVGPGRASDGMLANVGPPSVKSQSPA